MSNKDEPLFSPVATAQMGCPAVADWNRAPADQLISSLASSRDRPATSVNSHQRLDPGCGSNRKGQSMDRVLRHLVTERRKRFLDPFDPSALAQR